MITNITTIDTKKTFSDLSIGEFFTTQHGSTIWIKIDKKSALSIDTRWIEKLPLDTTICLVLNFSFSKSKKR